jgi:hypothetical protein
MSVKSVVDSISDLAGTVLYEAGFSNDVMDPEEVLEILRMLEDREEEGRALYPEILVTTKIGDCLRAIHPVQRVVCSSSAERPGRFRRAIKMRCNSADPWVIILEVSAERLTYGVATKNIRADAESLYEGVFDAARDTPNLPVMYFRRHGSRAVLIRTLKEERVVSLTLIEELLRVSDTITQFAEIVTQDVPGANQINSARVIARLLEQACREGHGIISCVIKNTEEAIVSAKRGFTTGACVDPPIDLSAPPIDDADAALTLENDSSLRAPRSRQADG